MSEIKKMATRDGYGQGLVELGNTRDDVIVFDADLAAATKTGAFKKAFPENFYNCGIAEQNMMSIAAGVATTGKTVFASSFAELEYELPFEWERNFQLLYLYCSD